MTRATEAALRPVEARSEARPEARIDARPGARPSDRTLPRLEERATFLIHRVNAKLAQACNPVFKEYDLDLYSSRILVALSQHGKLTVGALVELMALPQSTISHQLKRLERSGHLRRTRAEADNRTVEVTLTERGEAVAAICNQLSREIYLAAVATFTDAEIETLRSLLARMFDNLPAVSALRP